MTYLGNRDATGILGGPAGYINPVTAGAWVITFDPAQMPFDTDYEVFHGMIRGPGGFFLVYIDTAGYGVGENGLINEYTPGEAMYVRKGQTITLNWSITTGTAPRAWLYLRTPRDTR